MTELEVLSIALKNLSETVLNFPVGATSLDDLKPIDERIRNTRKSLKHLNARLLLFKAQQEFRIPDEGAVNDAAENARTTVTKLYEATANSLINNAAIKSCLHSSSIQAILAGEVGDDDLREKVYTCMVRLFTLNDSMLAIQEEIDKALQEQLQLKVQCRNELLDYNDFIKEQKEVRSKKLQETNPVMAANKEKTQKKLRSVNVMKKLIINFIAASNHMLSTHPILIKMLEDHRDTVTIETILEISQNYVPDEAVGESSRTQAI